MSARQSNNLLPRQTPTPSPPTRQPRLRRRLSSVHPVPPSATTSKYARQVLADQSQVGSCFFSLSLYYSPPNPSIAVAENQCQFLSGNNIISCFPTNTTTIPQHEWATFVCTSFSLYMRSSLSTFHRELSSTSVSIYKSGRHLSFSRGFGAASSQ